MILEKNITARTSSEMVLLKIRHLNLQRAVLTELAKRASEFTRDSLGKTPEVLLG
jgi:hypothetical protein